MSQKSGFTLLEVTIVLGILALLFAITSLNLSNTAPKSSLDSAVQLLIANIKQQQLYALTGKTENQTSTDFGIYFGPEIYTLFQGNTYDANNPTNYDVHLDDIDTSSTASGSVIIFSRITGQVQNFQPTGNTITLTQTNIQQSKTITINKYGIIESIL